MKEIVYAIKGKIGKTEHYNKLWEIAKMNAKLANCISIGLYSNVLADVKLIQNFGYDVSKSAEFSLMNSNNRSVTNNRVFSKFKSQNLKNIKTFEANPPTFKPVIYVNERNYKIIKEKDKIFLDITLQSSQVPKEERSFVFEWLANKDDRARQAAIDKIASGVEKQRQLVISVRNKRWYLSMAVSKMVEEETNISRCLGVQVARNRALQLAWSDSNIHTSEKQRDDDKRLAAMGHDIVHFRSKIEARRRSIQWQYSQSGRKGHGRKNALLPLEKLSAKYDNFKSTCNKNWASWVVKLAKTNNACIALEDLNGLNTSEFFLKQWTYSDLQSKIEMKASLEGVPVVWINPKNTTRQCTKCGEIDPENIKLKGEEAADFKCTKCGYFAHYGYNAALNIAKIGWETYKDNQKKNKEVS